MGKVELAVLRLGAYELRYDDDIPNGVAINEAIEIAKNTVRRAPADSSMRSLPRS